MVSVKLALSYLRRGWSVVPCHVPVNGGCSCGNPNCSWPGKHPRVPWREFTQRRPTEDEIREWFGDEFYGSNIGIVTGQVSNLVVVDVDNVAGLKHFKNLGLPPTLEAITGGGGRHYFYKSVKPVQSGIGVVEGIDIKAEGGFIVAPPSLHKSGRRYMWRWRAEVAKLDPALLPVHPRPASEVGWHNSLLDGVSEGERSISAARLTGRYAQMGLSDEETYMLLTSWNQLNNPPLPPSELAATIRSVYRRHQSEKTEVESLEDIYIMVRELTGRGRKEGTLRVRK